MKQSPNIKKIHWSVTWYVSLQTRVECHMWGTRLLIYLKASCSSIQVKTVRHMLFNCPSSKAPSRKTFISIIKLNNFPNFCYCLQNAKINLITFADTTRLLLTEDTFYGYFFKSKNTYCVACYQTFVNYYNITKVIVIKAPHLLTCW